MVAMVASMSCPLKASLKRFTVATVASLSASASMVIHLLFQILRIVNKSREVYQEKQSSQQRAA
jgi:hypothetical protein